MFSEITSRLAVASAYDIVPSGWEKLDVRGMIDGPGNAESLVQKYVFAGLQIMGDPTARLLVVCDYGQSRSNLIAAHIHSQVHSVTLKESLQIVRDKHPDSQIKAALLESTNTSCIRTYIQRIAITGGRGFIGARLCDQLTGAGFNCMALTRSEHGDYLSSSDRLHVAIATGCDLLIHFAHPKPYNSESTSQDAMTQLITVVNYCEDHGVRLLFPSGWVVFDGSSNDHVHHSTAVHPHTRYGRLKATAEAFLAMAVTEGLDARIMRLPGMFAHDSLEPRFLRYFAECVVSGRNIIFHNFENGSARVPLVQVDDCVKAIARAVLEFDSLRFITHIGAVSLTPTVGEIADRLAKDTGQTADATEVARNIFRGHFVPDITTVGTENLNDEINNFILQLCGKPYVTR